MRMRVIRMRMDELGLIGDVLIAKSELILDN